MFLENRVQFNRTRNSVHLLYSFSFLRRDLIIVVLLTIDWICEFHDAH